MKMINEMILINWGRRDNKKMRVHRVVDGSTDMSAKSFYVRVFTEISC